MHGTFAVASFLFNSKSNITANPNTATTENNMAENTAARFMCSFGGRIRHHHGGGSNNHQDFFYYGGNNRIFDVDRNISFHDMTAELSALCGGAAINFFKYLIPGDDLDTLVTVTNDRDLGYMMREYDLHFRGSASADRMRIFLFLDPVHHGGAAVNSSDDYQRVNVMAMMTVAVALMLILMWLLLVVATAVVVVAMAMVEVMVVVVEWWWWW